MFGIRLGFSILEKNLRITIGIYAVAGKIWRNFYAGYNALPCVFLLVFVNQSRNSPIHKAHSDLNSRYSTSSLPHSRYIFLCRFSREGSLQDDNKPSSLGSLFTRYRTDESIESGARRTRRGSNEAKGKGERARFNPGLLCFHSNACIRVGRSSHGQTTRRERDVRRWRTREIVKLVMGTRVVVVAECLISRRGDQSREQ